ncbi:lipocalin-like domain-containing protein [Sphingomonas sp. C3-2]|uniref:lipocalin-like domain-containing protein n=1 Tax=Sphingomonas sp. C3-2 TaxID=3062169 RepID=UPI00294B99FD|nr:lipocalin-like domain-containing protein [Sphingomonas sp. C3-2]WOK37955.1 lipocalin-like domain-containing protein [Sphingomonas sp. C3-2]
MTAADETRLVGTWHLLSYALEDGDGTLLHPLSERPVGQIIYDGVGNMSAHLLNPDPPARPEVGDGASYEARISYDRYTSYFGPYDVDTEAHTVSHHLVGALMPGWAGTTVVRQYAFEGDDVLILSADTGRAGQRAVLRWQRAKRPAG